MAYIDVPTNTNLVMDDKKILTVVPSEALVTLTDEVLTFSIEDGVYTITGTATLGGDLFADGSQIIIRGSVQAAVGEVAAVNNDGIYTVVDGNISATAISVAEPVEAAVSDAAAQVDEFDTFILHPTKRNEQVCVAIVVGATPSSLSVSFVPGGFWAAPTKKGLPLTQGLLLLASNTYLVQVETAKFLQDKEEELIPETEEGAGDEVMKKGTLLMRLYPAASEALTVEVDVGLVQLA